MPELLYIHHLLDASYRVSRVVISETFLPFLLQLAKPADIQSHRAVNVFFHGRRPRRLPLTCNLPKQRVLFVRQPSS